VKTREGNEVWKKEGIVKRKIRGNWNTRKNK
jgi:hypothetical protein